MKVILADPAITVIGWIPVLDSIGKYTLRVRKTPEEIKAEREALKKYNPNSTKKIKDVKFEEHTVIEHDINDPSVVYFLPGLWPRVKAELDKRGLSYEIEDKRNPDIRPPIAFDQLGGVDFRKGQDVALALIANSDTGIIETSTAWGKSFLVSVLCKALPTLNIVVCSSATTVVSTLYEYLDKQLPGQVGFLYSKGDKTKGKRVIVTTLKSLAKLPAENVHMVLVDECHDVGAGEAGRNLMRFCFARRFGFSASPVRNDGSGLVMESICGPTILRMTYDEAVDAGMVTPMKYLMLHCSGCPSIVHNPDMPDVFKKRFSYWCNSYRNKVIASTVYDIKKVSDCQILIVVATLEHAIRLHMQLPWFKVAYYGATDLKDIQKKFPKEKYPDLDLSQYKTTAKQLDIMRQAFAKGTLKYIISTYVFRQGCNFPDLQVLIRADGATSEVMGIQIPGRVARLAEGKKFAYLIDVDDAFDPWAEGRAKKRKELYDKQKWIPISRKELLDDLSAGDAKSTADDLRDGSTEEAESGEDNFSAQ